MREKSFGFIFWLAVFFCYCQSLSYSEENAKNRQTFVIRYKDGEQTIPVTVVLDYKKQTEYVINMNPRTPAKSVTLYDFKQRTIAYKDLTNGECFLGRLTHETLNEEISALQDVQNPVEVRPKVRSLDPRMPALTPTEIRNIAGQKTAVFCRKMNTWLLIPEKAHSIHKREVDEVEERTLQYHGHRSSQYSHYERETRRRLRNRSQPNLRRRSRTRESVAEKENGDLAVSEPSILPHHSNNQSADGVHSQPSHLDRATHASKQNHSSNYLVPPHSSAQSNVAVENVNSGNVFANTVPSSQSNVNHNHFRYPKSENRLSSSSSVPVYSRPHHFDSNDTDGSLILNRETVTYSPKNALKSFEENNQLARLISDDSDNANEAKTTTTENTSFPYQQGVSYPNVHSSLAHLLPLYKPLGQEFEFEPETKTVDQSNYRKSNQPSNIEREGDPNLNEPNNKFNHLTDVYNVPRDPDVSVNVLEIPRITKEFENIQNNGSGVPVPHPENDKGFHSSVDSYPSSVQTNSISSSFHRSVSHSANKNHLGLVPVSTNINRNTEEEHFKEDNIHLSRSEVPTTTGGPILTTRKYLAPEQTTSDNLYVPSVHTAFQNLEDFNSFQIFPSFIENNINPLPTDSNSSAHSLNGHNKFTDVTTDGTPRHLVLTTEYPLTEQRHNPGANHRADIPSEDNNDKSPLINHKTYALDTNNRTVEDYSSHKIRYQSVLRDFKPDEIVIDIENIPTHTPPPATERFRQMILTTVQPTIRSLSTESVRSEADRRNEQIPGTTFRSFTPTTRFPRRRLNDRSRRPVQSGSIPISQRNSLNQNRHQLPPPQINQLIGVNRFSSGYSTNRRQFHYPSRPIPPPSVRISTEMNQIHHMSHLNNLPPGVSIHPRHPQAPLADMVHSNRPPTIPILTDDQEYLKPHRQRHHKKKDRLLNSCCRLRGKSGAFQSCCRNGGPCCSRSLRRMQSPGSSCCSPSKAANRQIISANQIQSPIRTTNKILPPIRTEATHRSEVDNKDRCQKEKMCRTLYETTQQVMVCRNADIEGC